MKAMALLANYYGTVRQSRKSEQKREMFMKRLDIDSELCSCKYNSCHTPEVTIWCVCVCLFVDSICINYYIITYVYHTAWLTYMYELFWFPHIICTYAEGIE